MAQDSNSHDAPWLTNTQTEMFSVYAGNARSSCLVVGLYRCGGKLFHTRVPAASKLRSLKLLRPLNDACPDGG